jgi:hypothetical protein
MPSPIAVYASRVLRAHVADDRGAGVHADAHVDLGQALRAQVPAQLLHRLLHLDRVLDRVQRVVLVGQRRPQNAITASPMNCTTVPRRARMTSSSR